MSQSQNHSNNMKALEMEDEEVERFLDEVDGSLSTGRRGGQPPAQANSSTGTSSNLWKVLAALVVIVIVVSITYLQAETETLQAETETLMGDENDNIDIGNVDKTPTSPTTTSDGGGSISSSSGSSSSGDGGGGGGDVGGGDIVGDTSSSSSDSPTSTSSSTSSDAFVYSKLSAMPPDYESLPISDETRAELAKTVGKWKFFDGDEGNRPVGDYCGKYPNRDIPGEDFPDNAWQGDAVFVNHLIDAAENLIPRAKEAIFSEYGHGKPLPPEQLVERLKGFKWTMLDFDSTDPEKSNPPEAFRKHGLRGSGGWTTKRSQKGLVRRLLHAIMTNDNFVIVVAGHSAAAGHGGHFHQSYSMQMHRILAPVFARLGVKLVTRNMSQGGMGTIHHALGFKDLYGDDIDLLLWDSGMTEPQMENVELLIRQAILSGKKIPLIWSGGGMHALLKDLHQTADVDVGEYGNGMDTVQETTSAEQVKTLPYATQYMKCSDETRDLCRQLSRFCVKCWVPRDDLDPKNLFDKINEDDKTGGQVSWHLGWREHQLISRVLAMAILDGLQQAFQIFSEGTMGGPPLDESYWHVTDYYENIRNKLRNLPADYGSCGSKFSSSESNLPQRICTTVMKGLGLHTPRYKPDKSSLLNIVRAAPDGYKPSNTLTMAYEGPDSHNPCYDIPPGQVDVYAIVSGRRRRLLSGDEEEEAFTPFMTQSRMQVDPRYAVISSGAAAALVEPGAVNNTITMTSSSRDLGSSSGIVPGKGWEIDQTSFYENPGHCDGEYHSFCGRSRIEPCPMLGHHDSRGTLVGNAYSGWLVMDMPDVEEGLILIRIIPWLDASNNQITKGWTTENNERRRRTSDASYLRNSTYTLRWEETDTTTSGADVDTDAATEQALFSSRDLKAAFVYPEDMVFQFALNGKITSWDKDTFVAKKAALQRVTDVWTLLDDPKWPKGPVELAIRLQGSENRITVGVPQVYWA